LQASLCGWDFGMATHAQTIARELALALLSQRWEPRHLSPSKAQNDDLLLQHCLEEAIALREANQAGLSLELLVSAERMGLQSPWILDNQARALVNLGRRQAAWELWLRLSEHSDSGVADSARAMAAIQETTLLNALGSLCAREGWVPRHMNTPGEGGILERVLQEIIATRESNAAQLSLDLAVETLSQGWQDPWLLDNQARALVHLHREMEALTIWRDLKRLGDLPVAQTAAEMVELYEQRVARLQLQSQCEQLMREGQPDNARHLLLTALVQDPEARDLRLLLSKLLRPEPHDLLSQELEQHEAALAVHEGLLDALECRFKQRQPQH
jgi:tetratricopeptide (TPR) repeat protein